MISSVIVYHTLQMNHVNNPSTFSIQVSVSAIDSFAANWAVAVAVEADVGVGVDDSDDHCYLLGSRTDLGLATRIAPDGGRTPTKERVGGYKPLAWKRNGWKTSVSGTKKDREVVVNEEES